MFFRTTNWVLRVGTIGCRRPVEVVRTSSRANFAINSTFESECNEDPSKSVSSNLPEACLSDNGPTLIYMREQTNDIPVDLALRIHSFFLQLDAHLTNDDI